MTSPNDAQDRPAEPGKSSLDRTWSSEVSPPEPIVVRITNQRGDLQEKTLADHMPNGQLDQGDIVFTISDEMQADVVVVLNYLKYDSDLVARNGYMWNWHNEPIVRKPFAKGFDRIFTHDSSTNDARVTVAPPVLDWWVGKSYEELKALTPPTKSRCTSAIASTKTMIEGHRLRNRFLERVELELPDVDVFGEGRSRALGDKWDGLAPYFFSIAIENTSKKDYWTEKISDCFLSFTVPVYFGASNINDYFPGESILWLPLNEPDEAIDLIREACTERTWRERLDAVMAARELVLEQYSLFSQISRRIRVHRRHILTQKLSRVRVHGRRIKPGGWIRGVGLGKNFEARISKWKARRPAR